MSADDFRMIALEFPEASESSHMDHPDFRVRGKIFATLMPGEEMGVVKLTPAQQGLLMEADPEVFSPVQGGWGRRGYTKVDLKAAKKRLLTEALETAWRNTAPKRLVEEYCKNDQPATLVARQVSRRRRRAN